MNERRASPADEPSRMSREEWLAHGARVTNEMKDFTKPSVTPISKVIDENHGEGLGTGNYVEFLGRPHLLTNEHVARSLKTNSLGHQFLNVDTVYRATNPFHVLEEPVDAAVSRIEPTI